MPTANKFAVLNIYMLFMSMAFVRATVFGHVYIYEIPLFIVLCVSFFPTLKNFDSKFFLPLDILVFIYAFFNLVSVCVGIESLYDSARYYRAMVLSPVLVYVAIRYVPFSLNTIKKGFYLIALGILVQAVFFIRFYLNYGIRPDSNVEGAMSATITLSFLFCFSFTIFIFLRNDLESVFKKFFLVLLSIPVFWALIVSSTRAAVIGLLITVPLARMVWKNQRLRKFTSTSIIVTLLSSLLIIFSTAALDIRPSTHIKNEKQIKKSIARLFTPELYLKDLSNRISFWKKSMDVALQNPIFGSGSDQFSVGLRGGTNFQLSSVHNFLLSAVIVSGFPGLIIILLLIISTYRCLNRVKSQSTTLSSIGAIIFVSFTILIMIAMSNDLTGGRATLFFCLMAIAAKLSLEGKKIS